MNWPFLFLMDTHTFIWTALSRGKLSEIAAKLIANPDNQMLLSAASVWELSTKVRLGKLPEAGELERDLLMIAKREGYMLLPISPSVALEAGRLVGVHKDPFDRMIAAQALALDVPVISNDAALDGFGVRRIW